MKKQELLKKLIAHYTSVGSKLTRENWKEKIIKHKIQHGICSYVLHRYKMDLIEDEWIDYWEYWGGDGELFMWIKRLRNCKSFSEALENIETRIFLMTMELESGINN